MTFSLHARPDSALRCPACHDSLTTRACPECGTSQHAECYDAHGCTTLGCKGSGEARERGQAGARGSAPEAPRPRVGLGAALFSAALLLLGANLLLPELRGGSRYAPESSAIGSLKALAAAQSLFREGDREQDAALDYGTLCELGKADLIDEVLASGRKYGYQFVCQPGVEPQFTWWAMARPLDREAGRRSFFVNQEGVIYYTLPQPGEPPMCPCEVGPKGEPAEGWLPVGR